MLSMAAFLLQLLASTKTIRPIKPKRLTIWSFTENACQPLCWTLEIQKCVSVLIWMVVTWV